MKTRIIKTRMWFEDDKFGELNYMSKYGFIYYISNERIGMTGIYECPDRVARTEMGITKEQHEKIKQQLEEAHMVVFFLNWVFVVNAEKHNNYKKGKNNIVAYQKEKEGIPSEIITYFYSTIDSSIDSTIDSTHKYKIINNKQKVINNNKQEEITKAFLNRWNEVHGTKFVAWKPIEKNLAYWLETYSPEQVMQAIVNVKQSDFWKDKMTPVILLRRKNTNGEAVDYIGDLLHNGREAQTRAQKGKIIV